MCCEQQRPYTRVVAKAGSIIFKVALGLTLGVVAAEGAFYVRDQGAFPHLNLYVADAQRGVRLKASEQMKLRVADNPVTTVHTNSRGFRGADWPAPSTGEILVVGDSQVFGLGVEDEETFSAQLAKLRKTVVLNGGVPTYGPREYSAVVEEIAKERKLAAVVYVVNLANDLFEADRPNSQRHAVWDGWAVRKETAPQGVSQFPGREWLMSRSHLVFALRKLQYPGGDLESVEVETEGTWRDLVGEAEHTKVPKRAEEATRAALDERMQVAAQLAGVQGQLAIHLENKLGGDARFAEHMRPLIKRGDPRDILHTEGAASEEARPIRTTAYHLLMAAVGKEGNEAVLRQVASKSKDAELEQILEKRRKLRAQADALQVGVTPPQAPLEQTLTHLKQLCDQKGAKLLVVALPLDVMVSNAEWKKYGVAPIDMRPTRVLGEALVASAEKLGITAYDATNALLDAEPGAFLNADLHMTPKGHRALAQGLAKALDKTAPQRNRFALPEGRSYPPTFDEWLRVEEINVTNSSAAWCETKMVREWVRINCRAIEQKDGTRDSVVGLVVDQGGHGDALVNSQYGELPVALIAPVLPGDTLRARFAWREHVRDLVLSRPAQGPQSFAFSEKRKLASGEQASISRELWDRNFEPGFDSDGVVTCEPGKRQSGALLRCKTACDAKTPCAKGHCEPWPTGDFCAVP